MKIFGLKTTNYNNNKKKINQEYNHFSKNFIS